MYDKQRLIELIREHALEFGDFTLASGQKATFYLDCRKITLSGEGANQIAAGILDLIKDDPPQAVGGMAIGADPITAAVITLAWQRAMDLRGFIVRKETKSHGTGSDVEGPVRPGDRVLIVEDTVTTGGSSIRAIEKAEACGLLVTGIIAVIDRLAGAAQAFEKRGIPFQTLVTIEELGDPLQGA